MLSKSACLVASSTNKLFLARHITTTTTSTVYFLTQFKLNQSTCRNISSSNKFIFSHLKQNASNIKTNFYSLPFSSSSHTCFNKTSADKPSIIQTPPTTSEDLKKILNAQLLNNEDETKKKSFGEDDGHEKKEDGGGGGMFSKENAWKYSLGFFTIWLSGLTMYVLIEWGKPRVDEVTQLPVSIFRKNFNLVLI